MSHEHYSTLGISQNATEDEIKKAYRKKAMELHPDRHGGDKAKEAEFKKVAAAYQTLSDSTKKTNYDRYGTDDVGGGSGGFGGFQDMGDMSDIFSSFFGGQRGSTSRRRADIGEDIQVRMSISLEDAIRGTKKSIDYKKKVVCTVCNGTGAKVGTTPDTCATCRGSGQVRERVQTIFGTMEQQGTCRTCGGTGSVVHEKCDACTGGYVVQKTTQTIDIPAGIEDGMSIKMRNE
jgi:molecular chaperone DnaJ